MHSNTVTVSVITFIPLQVPLRDWLKDSDADSFQWLSEKEEGFQVGREQLPNNSVPRQKKVAIAATHIMSLSTNCVEQEIFPQAMSSHPVPVWFYSELFADISVTKSSPCPAVVRVHREQCGADAIPETQQQSGQPEHNLHLPAWQQAGHNPEGD